MATTTKRPTYAGTGSVANRAAAIAAAGIIAVTVTAQDPPADPRDLMPLATPTPATPGQPVPTLELPEAQTLSDAPAARESPDPRDQIRRALDGEELPDDGSLMSGVIDAIRRRGSVLEGSALESDSRGPEPLRSEPRRFEPPEPRSEAPLRDDLSPANYDAAESLLRSARLLQTLRADDPQTAALVNQMRRAAVKLLKPIATY